MASKKKSVTVTRESDTGRNERFHDGNRDMSRSEFVRRIRQGEYPGYHVREIDGVPTPVSNPDDKEGNNLG